jgi:hypothetical protein
VAMLYFLQSLFSCMLSSLTSTRVTMYLECVAPLLLATLPPDYCSLPLFNLPEDASEPIYCVRLSRQPLWPAIGLGTNSTTLSMLEILPIAVARAGA